MHEDIIEIAQRLQGEFELGYGSLAGSVAAAIESRSGKIYSGISIELACGIGFCAEHSAAAEMLKGRVTEISRIVAVGKGGLIVPCGRCRELIAQLARSNVDAPVVVSRTETVKLSELLPYHWLSGRCSRD